MWSVDFAPIERLQRRGDWAEAGRQLAALAQRLEGAGAECLLPCTKGRVLERSREQYRWIIADLVAAGAGGIIYGCTEIDLLVGPDDATVPVFDSTRIHVGDAVEWALTPARGPSSSVAPSERAERRDQPR